MVKTVIGLDAKGEKVFERPARAYDQGIANTVFGITIGDIIKAVPVIIACVMLYANNENFKRNQVTFNSRILTSTNENAQAIGGLKEVMWNLNNYLSSSTGKQFKDGRPI